MGYWSSRKERSPTWKTQMSAHLRVVCWANGGPEKVLLTQMDDLDFHTKSKSVRDRRRSTIFQFQEWDKARRPTKHLIPDHQEPLGPTWTKEELEYLKKWADHKSFMRIADNLHKSRESVREEYCNLIRSHEEGFSSDRREYYSAKEAAEVLGMSRATVYLYINKGKIKSIQKPWGLNRMTMCHQILKTDLELMKISNNRTNPG